MWDRDFMARQFGKSWYRIEAKNTPGNHICATIVPRLCHAKPVENLRNRLSDRILNSDHVWIRKDICERYLIIVKAHALESEPLLEVTKDPRDGSAYIARLTSLTHPISVFETVPKVVFDDDSMDHSVYWFGCRKRLKVKLRKLESALA